MSGVPYLPADVAPPPIWHNVGATTIALTPSLLIFGALALYLWGAWRVGRIQRDRPWSGSRTVAFTGAMAVTFLAIELFVGVYDDSLFYDHMIQHLLLIMVAAPLIAISAPLELLWRASTGRTGRVVGRVLSSKVAEIVGHPIVGFGLYAVLIPVAHLTSLYNFSLIHDLAHDNEHLAFLVFGYLFWRHALGSEPKRHPLTPPQRLIYLALAVPVDTFTGLALVNTTHEIFPAYFDVRRSWGPSLVSDLHIGGAIMWVGGDMLMVLAMIPVVVQWLRYDAERTRRLDAELDEAEARNQAASN
jgi:cytochrome c oxidase assembly factor CtaG